MKPTEDNPLRVAILVLPETSASVAFGMYDLFMSTGRDWGFVVTGQPGPAVMQPRIVARQREPFDAWNEVQIKPQATMEEMEDADVVCIPEVMVPPSEPLAGRYTSEIAWLQRLHSRGATIAAACSGPLLLAEGGLLDGQDATAHWAYCDEMRARYPKVKIHKERALVVTGQGQRLVMAGSGTSWLDLALYLIGRFVSVDAAMHVARMNLIDWHTIGQQPYARLASTRQVDDAVIADCQIWIADNFTRAAPVAAMARYSGLSERSFKRRFQLATGMSPLQYVHTLRLEEAKQALEATTKSIELIASEVGYEDASFFSRLFRRQVSLTPAQYRKRFGSMRRALQGVGSR
jgi:transcriptional regulator GlxA family with amidase domain